MRGLDDPVPLPGHEVGAPTGTERMDPSGLVRLEIGELVADAKALVRWELHHPERLVDAVGCGLGSWCVMVGHEHGWPQAVVLEDPLGIEGRR